MLKVPEAHVPKGLKVPEAQVSEGLKVPIAQVLEGLKMPEASNSKFSRTILNKFCMT